MIDLGSIFLILSLVLLVGLYVVRPLFEKRSAGVSEEEQVLSTLLAERDRILSAIQELDFDFNLGKIPQEDYPAQRQRLLQRGAAVLRRLDEADQSAAAGLGLQLEEAIAARAAALAATDGDPDGAPEPAKPPVRVMELDEIEKMIATRREAREVKAAGFCPECGNPVQETDSFCARCGATQKSP